MSQFIRDFVTQSILEFDAVADTERQLGVPALVDERHQLIAASLSLISNLTRQDHMKAIGDTTFTSTTEEYIKVLLKVGFELCGVFPFESRSEYRETSVETLNIYVHPETGAVLYMETFHGNINSSHVYYAWCPPKTYLTEVKYQKYSLLHRGGAWESPSTPNWRREREEGQAPKRPADLFWFGNHDGREALAFNLRRIGKYGHFLAKWPAGACSGLSLNTSMDYSNCEDLQGSVRRTYLQDISRARYDTCDPMLHRIVNGNI